MITTFRLNLIAIKEDTRGNKEELDNVVGKMRETLTLEKQAIPESSMEKIRVNDEVPRSEVPQINTEQVSDVKRIANVNEKDLDRFLEMLERHNATQLENLNTVTIQKIKSLIYDVKERYYQAYARGLSPEEIYYKSQPKISELYQSKQYMDVIGHSNGEDLRRLIANQAANLEQLRYARGLGIAGREDEAIRNVFFTSDRIFSKLNDIEFDLS
jgi:hypothetical protein